MSSFEFKSKGTAEFIFIDNPNIIFIHVLKKNVGAAKYNNISKIKHNNGNKSKKKLKNKNSAIKNIDPGKPKKTKQFIKIIKNNFGHRKFIPFNSVINLVLNLLFTASTSKNEFVDKSAWLINIQKLDNNKHDCPLTIHIVNQCISTTVE